MGGKDSGKKSARAEERANKAAQAEIRRQFDVTQENLSPFLEAGQEQLPVLQDRTTVGGLDEILGEIFGSENFQNLRGERTRAVQGQLSAGGLTRSGTGLQEAARVPTDLGFQLEQLLTGRSQQLVGSGQNAAARLGAFGQNASSQIAGLSQATGQAQSSGALADQQAKSQGTAQTIGAIASVAAMFFSDPNLKDNIEVVGNINGLNICQWDWKPETQGTMIAECGTVGFMADEVKEHYPQHVYDVYGFMMIDYPALLDDLDKDSDIRLDKIEGQPDANFKLDS